MASAVIVKALGSSALLCAGEAYVIKKLVPQLYAPADDALPLPPLYALVIFFNLVFSTFVLLSLSMKVGGARSKYKVPYPAMYATGDSDEAKTFNCIQRGHQQALETYTSFAVLSVIGGIKFPLVTAGSGLIWGIARIQWAEGYASGDPDKRYSGMLTRFIWYSLLCCVASSIGTAAAVTGLV